MKNKNLRGNLFTKTALSPSEATISKMIEEYLTAEGLYNDRLNAGNIFIPNKSGGGRMFRGSKSGVPDRYFLKNGRIYYVEVKMLGKKPTETQLARHAELREAGAVVLVCDSFDGFLRQFEKLEF